MSRLPAVIAVGLNCAAGVDADSSVESAYSGADALQKLSLYDSPRYASRYVAQANLKPHKKLSRCARMLYSALDEALSKVNLESISSDRISLYFGTSIGGIFETENMLKKNRSSDDKNFSSLSTYECSTLADCAAKRISANGECITYSTACSSSSLALADACNAISQRYCDVAIVCGSDALSRITVNGFGSLKLLSEEKCKPFDKNRDGINLGEAAGVLVLCAEEVALKINAEILTYVSGWACTCDAYHATSPSPDGSGALRAFSEASKKASLSPEDISYYNAHGTATLGNDTAESSGLRNFFGEKVPPFSSLKRIFGHTLGASGVVNAIVSIVSMNKGILPKNSGYENFDEVVSISPLIDNEKFENGAVLSASLGFGGNNGVAIFSKKKSEFSDNCKARKIFVYGKSVLGNGSVLSDAELLKDIAPLKKRRWTHIQKMGIEVSINAIETAKILTSGERIAVCWGTGLGMVSQTAAFVENIFEKNEAEPMPTAFTNSVHNAVSSAIAINGGFKALNSAVTAKEISFETAILQAQREIISGACDVAIVGSADEFISYSTDFLKSTSSKYSNVDTSTLSDFSSAYVFGVEGSCEALPLAELLSAKVYRRTGSVEGEVEIIDAILSSLSLLRSDVKAWFALKGVNAFQEKWLANLSEKLNVKMEMPLEKYGANYSVSGASISESIAHGSGVYLQYSYSSSSMIAITVWNVL